jgi:hypothetical protein
MSNNIKPAMTTVGNFKSKPATIPLNAGSAPVVPVTPEPVSAPTY